MITSAMIQRDVINEMRNNGSLFVSIYKTIVNNGGIASRKDIIAGVIVDSNMLPEVAEAKYVTKSGKSRSKLESIVDYTSLDIKAGKYGRTATNLHTDGSGVWGLDTIINIPRAPRVFAHTNVKTKAERYEVKIRYRKELAKIFNSLNVNDKKARSEERRVGKECRSRWSPDH